MTYVLVPYPEVPWHLPLDTLFDADQHVNCSEIYDFGKCARSYFVIEDDVMPVEAP